MMQQASRDTVDVLIVGAGPTGLMMACQLAVHQISFRIIEKSRTPLHNSGALIVHARTLEIFRQLGIAYEAISQGIRADKVDILYNAVKIAGTSVKNIGKDLSQFPFLLMLEQSKTEKLLTKFLEERGCYVERGAAFRRFTEDNDGITTKVIMPDRNEQTIFSKYIIGADGSRSAVRDFLNIPFRGKIFSRPIFILDSGISGITPNVISFAFSKKSVAGFFPLGSQRWRVDGSFPYRVKRLETISLETVTKGLGSWNNLNFILHDTDWFSVSHSQQRYASAIRVGNCFLTGDAAHVNTPVGAQGMNAGIQDAHNLAWKMAFVLKQKAKPALLDSYPTERMDITKGFAQYADLIFNLVTNSNVITRLFRTIVLKMYFKWIFPKLETNEKYRLKFFKSISQIGIHYKQSSRTSKDLEKFFLKGPKPCYRFPYVTYFYDGKNTDSHQILSPYRFTLVVLADDLTPEIKVISGKYNLSVVLIKYLPGTAHVYATLGIVRNGYYLIRPDMYIEIRSSVLETKKLNRHLNQLYNPIPES